MATQKPDGEQVERVPRTRAERERLLAGRQPGWEYLLFAAALHEGHSRLHLARREHELGLAGGPFAAVHAEQVSSFVRERLWQFRWVIGELEPVLAGQTAAFGEPGQEGDAELIDHLAGLIIRVYARLLAWASDVRSAGVPAEFQETLDRLAHAGDECVSAMDSFVSDVVAQTDRVPSSIADHSDDAEPLQIVTTLELTVDEALLDEVATNLSAALVAYEEAEDT